MPTPNPIAFTAFGIDVRWYGILIAIGIVVATLIVYKRAPRHGINPDKTLDFILICVPVGIIGARLYYVIFNWHYYSGDFFKMINLRAGGLAIHGGLILGLAAAAILCKLWNYKPLNILDLAMPAVALAQAIGRWGNYFNSEAHGGPTDLPWAITVDGQTVHPTFLYESIWCFILFFVLIAIDNNRSFEGQTFFAYGILYSMERFFVEFLRTDSLMLFGVLKQAMVLSGFVFVVFLVLYILLYKRTRRQGKIFYGRYSKYTGKFKQ
ncbi:prolipoprotein diacylglyceryl transferase [Clostridium aminobutyricum]|uniref:Phosphatidylglycerol--prolipoprotein diacylglyceryl transferase n=1 Tax=Clostridium aminobutyricum TaxID=33953 RepID=A0A939DA82_CLOAM|nr:prolipoprotein diacylglyceryl transferase [Clostridium aminobutyricum]MBN7774259.1 prolipoprotein diacylglyceryl transferase [Clostridium aminobutyricum]